MRGGITTVLIADVDRGHDEALPTATETIRSASSMRRCCQTAAGSRRSLARTAT